MPGRALTASAQLRDLSLGPIRRQPVVGLPLLSQRQRRAQLGDLGMQLVPLDSKAFNLPLDGRCEPLRLTPGLVAFDTQDALGLLTHAAQCRQQVRQDRRNASRRRRR